MIVVIDKAQLGRYSFPKCSRNFVMRDFGAFQSQSLYGVVVDEMGVGVGTPDMGESDARRMWRRGVAVGESRA